MRAYSILALVGLVSASWDIVSESAHILLGLITELSNKSGKTLRGGDETNGNESIISTGSMTGSSETLMNTDSVTTSKSPVTDGTGSSGRVEREGFATDGPPPGSSGGVGREGLALDVLPGSSGKVEHEGLASTADDRVPTSASGKRQSVNGSRQSVTRSRRRVSRSRSRVCYHAIALLAFDQCLGSSQDSQILYMRGADQAAGTFTLLA